MTVTTAEIREIQAGLAARNPVWQTTPTPAAITTPNGEPSGTSAGWSVQTSSGQSAVYTGLAVIKGANVTAYSVRWWGYYPGLAAWATLDGSARDGLDASWSQVIPSGLVARVYCEVTAVTGSDGVTPHVGPCDPGVA